MTRKKTSFTKAAELELLIDQYFKNTEAPPLVESKPSKTKTQAGTKDQKQQPDQYTIAGLALHLGFNSRQALEEYELKGKFADRLKRARLRIEEVYEKKLHTQFTSGAIYALKSLCRNERAESNATGEVVCTVLNVVINSSGPQLASCEQEVQLD